MTRSSSRGSEAQPESHPGERQPAFSFADPAPANRFYAIARDPRCIFVYWELAPDTARVPGASLSLLIHRANGSLETTCRLEDPGGTRVIGVSLPGTRYTLALGYLADSGHARNDMTILAERNVETPRDRPFASGGPRALALSRLFPVTAAAGSSSMP